MQKIAEQETTPVQEDECSEERDDQMTSLNFEFCFWFSYFKEQRHKQAEDYENNIKKIGSFRTAEEFWGYYQHIRRPDSLPKCCEFLLFKSGIRPVWEDSANRGGGRFVLHIKRIFANKTWEDIIIAFIITTKEQDHLNGVVINVRSWEVLLSLWMKPMETEEVRDKYRTWIRQSLGMTDNISIEYKQHPNPEEVKPKAETTPVITPNNNRDEDPSFKRDPKVKQEDEEVVQTEEPSKKAPQHKPLEKKEKIPEKMIPVRKEQKKNEIRHGKREDDEDEPVNKKQFISKDNSKSDSKED